LTAKWGKKISAYFELHKKYPENKSKDTKVKVSLVLNRRGNVLSVDVMESSGDPVFDDAADLDDPPFRSRSAAAGRPDRGSVLFQPLTSNSTSPKR